MNVLDNMGTTWDVHFTGAHSPHEFTGIRGGLDFKPYPATFAVAMDPDMKTRAWWQPIFVDWFIGEYIAPDRLPHQWTEHFT